MDTHMKDKVVVFKQVNSNSNFWRLSLNLNSFFNKHQSCHIIRESFNMISNFLTKNIPAKLDRCKQFLLSTIMA